MFPTLGWTGRHVKMSLQTLGSHFCPTFYRTTGSTGPGRTAPSNSTTRNTLLTRTWQMKVARLYKSCITSQRWSRQLAVSQSRLVSGGGQLRQQPEHLLVGVASATWTFLCLIRPYWLWVESHFLAHCCSFCDTLWGMSSGLNLKRKVNL